MSSICIFCGQNKKKPWDKCNNCGLVPSGEDLFKSIYCSSLRFEERDMDFESELKEISNQLKAGKKIEYNKLELDKLRKRHKEFCTATSGQVWITVIRFFLPGVLFLMAIYLILYVLKNID